MVKIITDTTSCLPEAVAERYDIPVIPQVINFGDESYLEKVNLSNAEFMEKLRNSAQIPKTAAPPPELFAEQFQRLAPSGEPILCIHPSTEVSGTVRSASVAALDFPGVDIRVIDTRVVASPLGTIVEEAAKWAASGMGIEEIIAGIENLIRRCRVYFLVATLDYLARGGRIGGATHLLGSVLQVKPILALRDGKVDNYEKERTHRRAVARLKEIVCEQAPLDGSAMLSVMHADVPEEAQALRDDLSKIVNQKEIFIADVPPAIVTHGGPGILGVGFFVRDS